MENTFTFLFTDIQGSTRLWEQHPQAMSTLLAEHNRILEEAVVSHHGKVFKTVGDGFCTVFHSADDALSAALDAQRALFKANNGQSIQLKVRIGLHCGAAEERDHDYFGPTLNRVARLMSVASGGQTVLSAAVKESLTDNPAIELRDLGKHRLRDLKELEHIFQVIVPDLPSSFPPLKSLTPRATNLPGQLSSFVGRERDVDDICRLIRQPQMRLLTLLGSGGIGKTRLSIQVGYNLLDEYEDGVFFVALAPVKHLEGVIELVAEALKVEETGEATLIDAVKTHLHDRHLLLVLDNFEQVIDASPLINELLAAAPRLKVVVTSREELMIYGERVYALAPLTLPEASLTVNIPELMQYSAIQLFVERVQSASPDFTVDTDNAPRIVEICQRLDGLPLAIELAAVRVRDLSLQAIAEQLSSRLQVLSKGPRDFPSRQRTMRGAIEWSYAMLPTEEQEAFAHLGVFVGAFTAEAADAIMGAQSLNRLREKSLIQQLPDDQPVVTFLMLETLREYALEQLAARSELTVLQRKHADYYIQLTETAEPNLTGASQIEWFNRLELERYNIQSALEWLVSQKDFAGAGRMGAVLWRYWGAHSRLSAGSNWLSQILTHPEALSTHTRAKVLHGAGRLLYLQYRYPQAADNLKASLTLYEQSDDQPGLAAAYLSLGEIELLQSHDLAAEGYYQNSLALYFELNDQAGIARCMAQLGRLAVREDNLVSAQSLFEQSLELIRQFGSTESIAIVINDLAEVQRAQGKYNEAGALYRESLALYRELDFDIGVAVILHNLGQVARQVGNYAEALQSFQEALRLLQEMEEKQIIAECLAGIGGALLHMGEVERAIRFLSAADALMKAIELEFNFADQADYQQSLDAARKQVDEARWAILWSEGQAMRLELVFADALRNAPARL